MKEMRQLGKEVGNRTTQTQGSLLEGVRLPGWKDQIGRGGRNKEQRVKLTFFFRNTEH